MKSRNLCIILFLTILFGINTSLCGGFGLNATENISENVSINEINSEFKDNDSRNISVTEIPSQQNSSSIKTTLLILIGFCSVLLIGFMRIWQRRMEVVEEINFANEYHTKFKDLANYYLSQQKYDSVLYNWLQSNVAKMQWQMGKHGIVTNYQPPYSNYIIPQYEILVNVLSNIGLFEARNREIQATMDMFTRYIGIMNGKNDVLLNYQKNPITWFQRGIQGIVLFPFYLLYWFHIINSQKIDNANDNILVNVIALILSITSFLASIMAIVLGGDEFIQIILEVIGVI